MKVESYIKNPEPMTTQAKRNLAALKSAVAEALINKREHFSMTQRDYSRIYSIPMDKIIAIENLEYAFSLEELFDFLEFLNVDVSVYFNNKPVV